LGNYIGNFVEGKEADFVVLEGSSTGIAQRRWRNAADIGDRLFAQFMLGCERIVADCYVKGVKRGPPQWRQAN
jgi:guanine deaminase